MAPNRLLPNDGYRFAEGVYQYSSGVSALPGFLIERAIFNEPIAFGAAAEAVERHLAAIGRPAAALCACELRSPKAFTEEGFAAFNRHYVATLERWGLVEDGVNPVARTNVCPVLNPPTEVSMFAFCYTVPTSKAAVMTDFVVAGSAEVPEGRNNYKDHIVRPGDVSPDGVREKARWVLAEMERRMGAFGANWRHATGTNLYTVHDTHPLIFDEIAKRGAMKNGLNWWLAVPPVVGLEYEMDVRRTSRETFI